MGINVFTGLSDGDDDEAASEDIDWSDTIGRPENGSVSLVFWCVEFTLLFLRVKVWIEDVKQVELKWIQTSRSWLEDQTSRYC